MRCAICGSRGYDGALGANGEFVCVDCWATGEAIGRRAKEFVPAAFALPVVYPPTLARNFVDACNRTAQGGSRQ